MKTTPLTLYIELLARQTVGDEPYHIDYSLGIITTQYQTWSIVIPEDALKLIKLEEV